MDNAPVDVTGCYISFFNNYVSAFDWAAKYLFLARLKF